MAVRIIDVEKGTPAHKYNIMPGDELVSINGEEIFDMMDLQFYSTDTQLDVVISRNGEKTNLHIEKEDDYTPLGLEFQTYLIDKQHSCKNKCIFCFVDQLPKGLRQDMYFKDDDERLSYLFGNYITLTNLSRREIDRIKKMKISPINISVHATDPDGQNVDPFAPPVSGIGTKLDEILPLHPGKQTGNRRVGKMKGLFNVFRAWGIRLVDQIAHDVALGCRQIHLCQRIGHGLVGTPMQDPGQVAVMGLQESHLQIKCSKLHNILAWVLGLSSTGKKVYNLPLL